MKKTVFSIVLIIMTFFALMTPVLARSYAVDSNDSVIKYLDPEKPRDTFDHNCADFAKTLQMGGYFIFIIKILVPLFIIVKASMNVISLVMSGKSDDFKKLAMSIAYSCIAAIVIFFIPTLINTIFGFVDRFNAEKTNDSEVCVACVFDPFSETCTDYTD
ncbi:MAG TPA: hypothetical protein DCY94_01595 [Firmicutes bacterium]|nr:hypothetical protein [Bacillota bacterium]